MSLGARLEVADGAQKKRFHICATAETECLLVSEATESIHLRDTKKMERWDSASNRDMLRGDLKCSESFCGAHWARGIKAYVESTHPTSTAARTCTVFGRCRPKCLNEQKHQLIQTIYEKYTTKESVSKNNNNNNHNKSKATTPQLRCVSFIPRSSCALRHPTTIAKIGRKRLCTSPTKMSIYFITPVPRPAWATAENEGNIQRNSEK